MARNLKNNNKLDRIKEIRLEFTNIVKYVFIKNVI